jgi:hypothetical protein
MYLKVFIDSLVLPFSFLFLEERFLSPWSGELLLQWLGFSTTLHVYRKENLRGSCYNLTSNI